MHRKCERGLNGARPSLFSGRCPTADLRLRMQVETGLSEPVMAEASGGRNRGCRAGSRPGVPDYAVFPDKQEATSRRRPPSVSSAKPRTPSRNSRPSVETAGGEDGADRMTNRSPGVPFGSTRPPVVQLGRSPDVT